ncbi:hypothetical protein IJI76_03350 [Candidatus Saccharibacteria bacterium]|nr:hypothetical protein [Candidatus Saccharibacteria bacterium]
MSEFSAATKMRKKIFTMEDYEHLFKEDKSPALARQEENEEILSDLMDFLMKRAIYRLGYLTADSKLDYYEDGFNEEEIWLGDYFTTGTEAKLFVELLMSCLYNVREVIRVRKNENSAKS